ncbi:hypothetical protein BDN72DRAFT_125584 [Pluteus cervinus]|uniref:Uncharacterized protein n=1 Tax=Pluteus cervinus TaxID=181527 RepID=A0ACD3ANS9_9AGAR|nr:hypothetical protein BDN72DRAFT_125584 [Pluteus cervinus]
MDNAWGCAHCGRFLNNVVNQAVVVQHLRLQHHINRPNIHIDVVYLPKEERTPRRHILLPPLRPFDYATVWTSVIITGGETEAVLKRYHIAASVIERLHALVCTTHPKFTGKKWVPQETTGVEGMVIWGKKKIRMNMRDTIATLVDWIEVEQGLPQREDPYLHPEDDPLDDEESFLESVVTWSPNNLLSMRIGWGILWKRLVWFVKVCRDSDEGRLERYYARVMAQPVWCLSERQARKLAKALMVDHSGRGEAGERWWASSWRLVMWVLSRCVGCAYLIAWSLGCGTGGAIGMWLILAYT